MAGPLPSFPYSCFLWRYKWWGTLLSPFGPLVTTGLIGWTRFCKAGGGRVGAFVCESRFTAAKTLVVNWEMTDWQVLFYLASIQFGALRPEHVQLGYVQVAPWCALLRLLWTLQPTLASRSIDHTIIHAVQLKASKHADIEVKGHNNIIMMLTKYA